MAEGGKISFTISFLGDSRYLPKIINMVNTRYYMETRGVLMAEKVMLCEDCGKMFRVEYDLTKIDELICPSCDGINIASIYKQQNKIGL